MRFIRESHSFAWKKGKESSKAMSEAQGSAQTTPDAAAKKPVKPLLSRLFMKQKLMLRVVYALIPLLISGIYFFGWRVLAVLAVTWAAGLTTEYVMAKTRGQPVSMANFVSCWLLALSLPPTIPLWMAAVGGIVAILFGKEVFGGFGRNFANPAIVGRTFLYVSFPTAMTNSFIPAYKGFPGGFAHWNMLGGPFDVLPAGLPGYLQDTGKSVADAVSQASPMWVNKSLPAEAADQAISLWDMATGAIGGTFQVDSETTRILSAGSIGEGSSILIIVAAIYLLYTKTANWRLMLSAVLGLTLSTWFYRYVLGFTQGAGVGVPPIYFTLLAGTTLYVTVFMITDPVSAPNRKPAQWAYGALIGFLVVTLRWQGIFVAAASFSILLGNLASPLLDMGATAWADYKKARAKKAKAQLRTEAEK
jgi:Na+-transporting NADH:ubiquinone oxidoreductase subunit B